jgi:hypothetical protein
LEDLEAALEQEEIITFMRDKNLFTDEKRFSELLVSEYLKYGSVDEVLRINKYCLPISHAHYHRLLTKWGIIKAAGPNSKMAEILGFMTRFAEEKIPLEALYKKMPPSFMTSAATMYRIVSYVKEGITRRLATGLIITPASNKNKILVGDDVSTPRLALGKPYGSTSIPMGFSRKRDSREEAILRILQQEVFTKLAIKRTMPDIISSRPKPFMFLDIADVRVEIFHLKLPKKLSSKSSFSSFKLQNYRFLDKEKIIKGDKRKYRLGVKETAQGYEKYLKIKRRNLAFNPLQYKSSLNYYLAEYSD